MSGRQRQRGADMLVRVIACAGAAGLLGTPSLAPAAVSAAQRCASAKLLASGKFVQCRLKAEAARARTGDDAAWTAALSACEGKLATAFQKAEEKFGVACPTVEPLPNFRTFLAQCADQTASAGNGGQFGSGGSACGDGVRTTESCDGGDLGGETCESLGQGSGMLGCSSECAFDTTACVQPACGNGVLEAGEQCEGAELGGETCASQGYPLGNLTCTPGCTFDLSGCSSTRCCQVAAYPGVSSQACVDIEEAIASETCAQVATLIPGTALSAAGTVCSGATGACSIPPAQTPGNCCELFSNYAPLYGATTCAENGSATDCTTINSYISEPTFCTFFGFCGTATLHPGAVCRRSAGGYSCQAP